MQPFFIYLIKANAALALFYLLYVMFLRKDTFLRLKRHFFLAAIVFSLAYPFFAFDALKDLVEFPQSQNSGETSVSFEMPVANALLQENDERQPKTLPLAKIAHIMALGSALLALRLCWQIGSIIRLKRKSRRMAFWGVSVWSLPGNITPFSFFKWIFLNPETHSESELRQILVHERAHARQCHSADIMLCEWLCVIFWWNPVVWMMKREAAINLEYLADNSVISAGVNSKEYQYHLLKLTYHETAVQIVNNFNVSQLKQRIMMMNKSKSPARKLAKYLTILPVAFLLIVSNSCLNDANKTEGDESTLSDATVSQLQTSESKPSDGKEKPFMVVEVQPSFPGGLSEMMKFLSENIVYPETAKMNNIEGRVIVSYIVEKDGSISEIEITKGVNADLDNEALRVVESMPKWIPGKQDGQMVRVRYTLPILFRLASDAAPASTQTAVKESKTDEVYTIVQQQPQYSGGSEAMMKFLSDNIKYPATAVEKGIQGRVICSFIVEKDGSISNIQVKKGVDEELDKEAIRVIKSMPKWKPGVQNGEAVRTIFTLPVIYRLQK